MIFQISTLRSADVSSFDIAACWKSRGRSWWLRTQFLDGRSGWWKKKTRAPSVGKAGSQVFWNERPVHLSQRTCRNPVQTGFCQVERVRHNVRTVHLTLNLWVSNDNDALLDLEFSFIGPDLSDYNSNTRDTTRVETSKCIRRPCEWHKTSVPRSNRTTRYEMGCKKMVKRLPRHDARPLVVLLIELYLKVFIGCAKPRVPSFSFTLLNFANSANLGNITFKLPTVWETKGLQNH